MLRLNFIAETGACGREMSINHRDIVSALLSMTYI